MRTRIGAGVLATTLLLAGVVPAAAQEGGGESATVAEAPRRPEPRRAAIAAAVEEELGLDRREIVVALARGETLADLAEAAGSSGEELVSALLRRVTEAVEAAEAEGRIDADRAAELTARAEERIRALVFEPHPGAARRTVKRAARHRALGTVADMLDVSVDELRAELAAGRTIADVAADRGVDVDELVDAVMAPLEERAAAAVEAGRADADRMAERLDRMRRRLTERFTTPVGDRGVDR